MPQGVLTTTQLEELVADYSEFDEFVFDIESKGPTPAARLDPHRNDVFWISMAGPGRADAIPMGHPIGELIEHDLDGDQFRINPSTNKIEEHRINPDSGRLKWFRVPEEFTEAPKQLWRTDVMEALRPLLFSERRKVNHTLKFDLKSLAKYYAGEVPPPPYGDIRVATRLINENHHGYRLGDMIKRSFHFEYDKSVGKEVEKYPYSVAHLYSYLDSKYAWLLWRELKPLMKKEGIRHIFDLEMDLLPAIMDMELTGVSIDKKVLESLHQEFSMEMAKIQVDIEKVYGKPINLNANRQIADLVYETLGRRCYIFTGKTHEPSTSKEALEYHSKNPTVAALLQHSQLQKLHGSFVVSLQEKITEEGRIHGGFDQVGTVSGRFSSSSPNLQQIPIRTERGKRLREVFVAGPGNVLIVADLSQIELRMLAHYTQDRNLMRAYKNGQDLHALTAESAFGPDFTPAQRGLGKSGNFSLLFGAGAKTMVRKYGFPNVRVAQQVLDGFYNAYPRVKPWKAEVIEQARRKYRKGVQQPYVETILGRKRRLPELMWAGSSEESRLVRAGAERQAVSVTISGSAGDLFKLAMGQCYNGLQEVDWEGHILIIVHDELVVEVPERYAEEGLELVKSSMESIVNPFTGESILSVPIEADAKVAHSWAEK